MFDRLETFFDVMVDFIYSGCPMGKLHCCITAVQQKSPPLKLCVDEHHLYLSENIQMASKTNVIMHECRCVPSLPADLAEDLVTGASYISKAETQLSSLANSLGSNQQRLRRYISDINRGRWIIIAAGRLLTPD